MLISIWGRDGIGKSTLCDTLGILFAKHCVTTIIDTDLTQPTLPARVNGKEIDADASLGKAVGIGAMDAAPYLHQHPKLKTLFYAGLTDRDEYLSYELGLETDNMARDFVERCSELADTVILDLSGQRNDPFLPGALINADRVIALFTPDIQGVCWYNSVKPLLNNMGAQERVLPVAAMVNRHNDITIVERTEDIQFIRALPCVREFRQDYDASIGTTPAAMRYLREVKKLYTLLKGADRQ